MSLRVVTLSLALASVCDGIIVRREGSSNKKTISTLPPTWFDNGADISASQPNFANVTQVHSNLGGLGPDGGLEAIVYENIGSYKGQMLDLVFQTDSTYTPSNVDNNKINTEGHMGQINIECGSSVDLSVHIVKSGYWANSSIKDNEVALPIMFFSVLDFDAAQYDSTGTKGVEQVTISPVFEYKVGPAVDVAESGPNEYTFTATQYGTGSDNPTDVYSLTEEQEHKAVMIAIRNSSSWSMTLAASACSKGRNMLFTGPSPMHETVASCNGMNTPDLSSATVSVNNLGGHGPGAAMMQLDNIMTYKGQQIDLQVIPIDGNYQSNDPYKNMLSGKFFQINVAADSSVVFRFQLLSEGEPISVPDVFFAYYDIDGTDDTFETLSLLGSSGTYFLSDTSMVTAMRGPSKTTFTASAYGNLGDNPSGEDVSDRQKDFAVEVHFEGAVQYWDIEFGTAGFHTGRNFEFSGSTFACE